MHSYARFTIILSYVFLLNACDINSSETSRKIPDQVQIEYVVSGGIFGATFANLTVSEDGLVTNKLTTPKLELQLPPEEYAELIELFEGFFELPQMIGGMMCADDSLSKVTLITKESEKKSVSVWGCTLGERMETDQNVMKIGRIIFALSDLADTIYQEKAPWVGLKVDISLDNDTFGVGETITMTFHITNPTEKERTLYFIDEQKTGFTVRRPALPNFIFRSPPESQDDTPSPDELQTIHFAPGEEIVLTNQWDQTVTDSDGMESLLEPDRYFISLRVMDTSRSLSTEAGIPIDVVD
jgi:hypothetical protein